MTPSITGLGIAKAPYRYKQSDILKFMMDFHGNDVSLHTKLEKIYDNSGIKYRYSVLEDFGQAASRSAIFGNNGTLPMNVGERMQLFSNHSLPMASVASRSALLNSNLSPEDVTHLLTVSCTGLSAPGLESKLIKELSLKPDIERLSINFMGCYAAINALKIASHIVRSSPGARVLIAGTELCTLHLNDTRETGRLIAHALFSDGAAAAVVAGSESNQPCMNLEGFQSVLLPEGESQMSWHIDALGFEMELGREVPVSLMKNLPTIREKLLQNSYYDPPMYYAIHPGGTSIVEGCRRGLGLMPDQTKISLDILRDFGNMSSVTLLFLLDRLWKSFEKQDLKNASVFACAFGPGLTIESGLLNWKNYDQQKS